MSEGLLHTGTALHNHVIPCNCIVMLLKHFYYHVFIQLDSLPMIHFTTVSWTLSE